MTCAFNSLNDPFWIRVRIHRPVNPRSPYGTGRVRRADGQTVSREPLAGEGPEPLTGAAEDTRCAPPRRSAA